MIEGGQERGWERTRTVMGWISIFLLPMDARKMRKIIGGGAGGGIRRRRTEREAEVRYIYPFYFSLTRHT